MFVFLVDRLKKKALLLFEIKKQERNEILDATKMDKQNNYTRVTEFILLRFTDDPKVQVALFLLFLVIYVITVAGSLSLIVLIKTDSHFHTPMYFFLCHLSFTDLWYTSAIAPKMLVNFLVGNKTISYAGCAAQLFSFAAFVSTESFLLAVMAFDRYMAICNPLLYSAAMSQRMCNCLLAGSYAAGFVNSALQTLYTFRLPYCRHNIIRHFFCDIPKLLKLSCSEIFVSETLTAFASGTVVMTSVLAIIISCILSAILKIHCTKGRCKAFSTCASHLTSVALLYGTGTFIYIHPNLKSGLDSSMVVSVVYTLVIPMLNPLIYSLRNKEVKEAIRKATAGKKNNLPSKSIGGKYGN
ncbi:olfactory receptor 5G9-like [Rhineura floridana]|uniref:olfactory receptor 5G9-like n=1 Tax=Rhineura floridana TaxID=261503 RepID=UPI002AC85F0E|nr:olfactory receptor 5G9-like [Rhineura floridana]